MPGPNSSFPSPPSASTNYYSSFETSDTREYNEHDFEEIYFHFDDCAQEIVLSNASEWISLNESELYEWEDVILDEASQFELKNLSRSCLLGLGCGLAGFGLMRLRRGMVRNSLGIWRKYQSRSGGGYELDPVPGSTFQNYLNSGPKQPISANSRSGLLFDVALSTILGMGISLLAIESEIFYPLSLHYDGSDDFYINNGEVIIPPPQWISPIIPLVPGRSMVSDLLCQPLTEEFRKFPKALWQAGNQRGIENGYNNHIALYANGGWKDTKYYNSNRNASVVSLGENSGSVGTINARDRISKGVYEHLVIDSLQEFVINCERRSRYEKKLRKLRGMKVDAPVTIPEGGVPADEDLELDDIYLQERDDNHFRL